jgi:hypothetical protein
MTKAEIVRRRLFNQRLIGTKFDRPEDVVRWLGAVQAQEYPDSKWGLAQRMNGATDAAIEQAFAEGRLLRTHVMRPTWHYVTPADIRWLLKLTAPRVNTTVASYYRKFGLDDAFFARSNDVLARALEGGKQLTRAELAAVLEQAGVIVAAEDRVRFSFVIMRAELDGLICSGARRGKQHTYALLEERVPRARILERDEALAELTLRYFKSHGPATVKDFGWWSGLTAADVRAGIEMNAGQLEAVEAEELDGATCWFAPDSVPEAELASPVAHLLPPYDEYTIAYKNHSTIFEPEYAERIIAAFGIVIIIDGRIAGAWKRTFRKGTVEVILTPFRNHTESERQAIVRSAEQYSAFLNTPAVLA